jgi:hypothetical protein
MIFDFDKFSNANPEISDNIGDELISKIKDLCKGKFKSQALSSLCLAFAIYWVHKSKIPHIHEILSSNSNEICCLFMIIKSMMEEAYNDSIVV